VFISQACKIPHKYLNGELKMPTCSFMKARVRAHNSVCWGEWSEVNTGGALVKGALDNLNLVLVSNTAESASISLQASTDAVDSTCTQIDSFLVEIKEDEGDWKDLDYTKIDDGLKSGGAEGLGSNFSQDGLKPCQVYYFRAKATSLIYPGSWSEAVKVKTKCPGPQVSTELPG
jgi:hypothetical protein